MKLLLRLLFRIFELSFRAGRKILMLLAKYRFRSCGRGVIFNPFDVFSYKTISIGNNVFIGEGAIFQATESSIVVGNKVMFGPRVMIMGGDHNAREIGRYMYDVKEKMPGNDLPVIVEDDVWIGCGAIILKGVTIGRGSIIGAGSLVNKSIPRYSIAAGNPARVLKARFDAEQIVEHERILGIN
ncbi:MAG: acyltransferase [Gallionella sp.]|nr:acyltransferase [Gallionella sp.]